jgi:hypothetical protein
MKNRLVTFGCSYTYGQGLPDCQSNRILGFTFDSSKPSKLGWAQQVADALGLALINQAKPGASNLEILYAILEFKFEKTDTVVIMWSHSLRDMFIKTSFNMFPSRKQLGSWKTSSIALKWAAQLSEHDYAMRTWIYMHHAGLYLNKQNLQFIHYPATMQELNKFKIPNLTIDNLHRDGIIYLDQCIGDSHPGLQSNFATANIITGILQQVS